MSIYNVGTVDVTHDSATVTGDGTQTFLTSIAVNQLFKVTGYSTVYMVASLISNNSFTISPVWADITLTGASYNVIRDYTPVRGYPLVSQGTSDWPVILSKALTAIDTDHRKVVGLSVYASNALALAGGLVAGDLYRSGADPDFVAVVH